MNNFIIKLVLSIAIVLFVNLFSFAQKTDSTKVIKRINTKISDSIKPVNSLKVIKISKVDSLKFKLDSLLKPFYVIEYDSALHKDIYTPRYRMSVHSITKDTIYIPIPKPKNIISVKKKLVVDTLHILNPIQIVAIDTTKFVAEPIWWKNKNSIGFDISEAAFINWNAGGNNSISGLLKIALVRSYKKLHLLWNNEIFARYGLNSQQNQQFRKTDDNLQINSTFGYRRDTISNWFYSVKFNLKTQFTNGFSYPDTSTPISKFFAPGYLFLGMGTQYEIKQRRFSMYLSPITLKSTFVLDKTLSNEGAFGVDIGKKSRHEFGALVQSTWNAEIAKNIIMSNRLNLYSDYLNNFGNIDIDWELNFRLIVNKYIKANIGTHIIYDDDIKFKDDIDNNGTLETLGARVQLKQLLGIGVLFNF